MMLTQTEWDFQLRLSVNADDIDLVYANMDIELV